MVGWSSAEICFLPAWSTLDFSRQEVRKPRRCHSTTVSGFTTSRELIHSDQNRLTAIQKQRSHLVSLGAGVVFFQDRDLLSEGEVFQQQTLSTAQEATDSSEEE
jgi:hypothetical protein